MKPILKLSSRRCCCCFCSDDRAGDQRSASASSVTGRSTLLVVLRSSVGDEFAATSLPSVCALQSIVVAWSNRNSTTSGRFEVRCRIVMVCYYRCINSKYYFVLSTIYVLFLGRSVAMAGGAIFRCLLSFCNCQIGVTTVTFRANPIYVDKNFGRHMTECRWGRRALF